MAALQTIRSKGALLVGVLGLALFAFIAEEFFRSLETTSMVDRNQVGEVYGEKLSIQDFQTKVEEQSLPFTSVNSLIRKSHICWGVACSGNHPSSCSYCVSNGMLRNKSNKI